MSQFVIGQPVPRVDGRAKVTGAATYSADFNQPNQVYAVIVSATVGLGRVVKMNSSRVEEMPGIISVINHRNAPRLLYRPNKSYIDPASGERLHVLQDDAVRFFGQPVAIVVADTERAAAALEVSYEARKPNVDLRDTAVQAISPEALPGELGRGDAEAALATASVKVDETYEIARENHNPMEPHATVAAWDGDRLTLWSKTQFVVNEQAEIAAIFGLPTESVQVICPFIGGGFGTSLRHGRMSPWQRWPPVRWGGQSNWCCPASRCSTRRGTGRAHSSAWRSAPAETAGLQPLCTRAWERPAAMNSSPKL